MTLTGGSTWESGETGLTLTDSGAKFVAGDNGDDVWFDPDGSAGDGPLKMRITSVDAGGGFVTVTLLSDIPAAYRATATTDWGYARNAHTGYHLPSEPNCRMLADGKPQALKTDPDTSGDFTTSQHHTVVVVGIEVTSQVQSLQAIEGRAYVKNVANAEFEVDDVILPDATAGSQSNSGISVGEVLTSLRTIGTHEDDVDNRLDVRIDSTARRGGSVALQCVDGIPLTIRGITRWVTPHGGR